MSSLGGTLFANVVKDGSILIREALKPVLCALEEITRGTEKTPDENGGQWRWN